MARLTAKWDAFWGRGRKWSHFWSNAVDRFENVYIATGTDDGHEYPSGSWNANWTWFGHYGSSDEWLCTRLTSVNIPKDATIISAYYTITEKNTEGGTYTVNAKVRAELIGNASAPSSGNLPHNFTLTTAGVDLDVSSTDWVDGQITKVNVTSIIQEIVNQSGWAANNAINIVIVNDGTTGDHDLEIYDYVSNASKVASLYVEYSSVAGAGGSATMNATVQTYTETGISLTALKYNRYLTAELRTYSESGVQVNLLKGRTLTAILQTYTESGTNLTALKYNRYMTAVLRTYAESGVNLTALKYNRYLASLLQTYTESGVSLTGLKYNRRLTADLRTYVESGVSVNLLKGRILSALLQTYSESGISVNLLRSRYLEAILQTYAEIGIPVVLTKTGTILPILTANVGSYLMLGQNPVLFHTLTPEDLFIMSLPEIDLRMKNALSLEADLYLTQELNFDLKVEII